MESGSSIHPPEQSSRSRSARQWLLSGCVSRGSSLQVIRLNSFPYQVGRRQGLELTLDSPRVSGLHAEFFATEAALFVRDLNSTNGTYVNGVRLSGDCPIGAGDRIQFADYEFIVDRSGSKPKPPVENLMGTVVDMESFESLWIVSRFDQLLAPGGVRACLQPIVSLENGATVACEALARSDVSGLEQPDRMFGAATQLGREVELSNVCRLRAMEAIAGRHPERTVFLNTHPAEDLGRDVLPSLVQIRRMAPTQKLAIELHEGAVTNVKQMRQFKDRLDRLDIELAYDDFGAGQARLRELIEVPPHYIKFDAGLLRNIHRAPLVQHTMLKALVDTARTVGAKTLAEGIESRADAQVCRELQFDLAQGYLFGSPAPPESDPTLFEG